MKYDEGDMMIIIKAYEDQGIVTRQDFKSLDVRTYARGLASEMEKRGYREARYEEVGNKNYSDFSGVLYNLDKYTPQEARQYLIENVLVNNF